MATLDKDARKDFWSRSGTFGICGAFEGPDKLSWKVLAQCQEDGVAAVPVNPDLDEVLGVAAVDDPSGIESLAGIVCVRLDPHATDAVERAGELGVPVLYLDAGSYHGFHRFVAKAFGKY